MKILYVTRLFSGLESSFINGTWDPTGVPTIYKVIKELDEKYETILKTAKELLKEHIQVQWI